MVELEFRINSCSLEDRPDLVAITEVKPKHYEQCFSEIDFSIKGYTTHLCNHDNRVGKGIVIYVTNNIDIMDCSIIESFEEAISIKLRLQKGDALLICVVYRNPSSSDSNNRNLIDLLEVIDKDNSSHKLLVGDFNLPNINWCDCLIFFFNEDTGSIFLNSQKALGMVVPIHND